MDLWTHRIPQCAIDRPLNLKCFALKRLAVKSLEEVHISPLRAATKFLNKWTMLRLWNQMMWPCQAILYAQDWATEWEADSQQNKITKTHKACVLRSV